MASGKRDDRSAKVARQRLRDYEAKQTVHSEQIARRRRDNVLAAIALVAVLVLVTLAQVLYFTAGPGTPAPTPTGSPSASPSAEPTPGASDSPAPGNTGDVPSAEVAEGREWSGSMQLASVDLDFALDGAAAPQGVSSFVQLVRDDFYTGKTCHRLTDGGFFVLQCGSVDGAGGGDAGFRFGPVENAPQDEIYPAGTIALARQAGDAYSHTTQFFIVYEDTQIQADAAGGYTVLGRVTSGLDELRSEITSAGTADGSNEGEPAVPVTIDEVAVQ